MKLRLYASTTNTIELPLYVLDTRVDYSLVEQLYIIKLIMTGKVRKKLERHFNFLLVDDLRVNWSKLDKLTSSLC